MIMEGVERQGLPKQLISWSYTMDNTKTQSAALSATRPWYAFEHIAALKTWGNVEFTNTPTTTNTVVISQYGGFINRDVAATTLKRAPIVWKQRVMIETSSVVTSQIQLLQIPMMIAFDRVASFKLN
eukprot:UN02905